MTHHPWIIDGHPMADIAREPDKLLEGKTVYSDGRIVDRLWLNKPLQMAGNEPAFSTSTPEMILTGEKMDTRDRMVKEPGYKRYRTGFDATIVRQIRVRTREGADKKG